MCRMVAYRGSDRATLRELADCLVKAAEDDPLKGWSHPHGWGMVALTEDKLIHHRSSRPIFEPSERSTLINLVDSLSGKMMVIIHARKASDPSLVSSMYSHPYQESNDREVIYLAHNGSVDLSLAREVGMGIEGVVDSELVAKYISMKGIASVGDLIPYTKSALNLLILQIPRGVGSPLSRAKLYYFNWANSNDPYYDLYVGSGFVTSSSLSKVGCRTSRVAEKGKLLEIHET
ncbi:MULTISPECIES: class II glutamine amidotransferase [Metallosphaera]|uniref:class II glutamine amidotransferase n=1 Tax=Metallosphaera TaxID=41980 RepID=UPI001F06F365|nr:class II glutamine amidotransferase [Metallosphaera sedula]MCH1772134.1 class II glutamine amidotransferase [Metallosphaera sedula]MCP6727679.1 class II glutamine amidotransferase [Metallosphaera sedula]